MISRFAQLLAKPPLVILRALHSGDVADYVTWIVVGTAVVGALCALLMVVS